MIETESSRKKFERETGRNLGTTQKDVTPDKFLKAANEARERVSGYSKEQRAELEKQARAKIHNGRKRADYMRSYRAREKKCPHCGKSLVT